MNIYNPGEAELLLERGKVWKSMPMIGSYFNGLDKQDELNLSILLTNQTKYLLQLNSEQLATIGSSPADIKILQKTFLNFTFLYFYCKGL